MVLSEWLQYLESLPRRLKSSSLEQLKNIGESLDLLTLSSKIITVAGTNGKGSCVKFLESILLEAGISVGAYTSPHLLRYNERVRLNGKEIDDSSLVNAFEVIKNSCKDDVLSYFAFSTLAALYIFKSEKPDVVILEVGLGGRFDPVNIIDSDIAVITTVAFDHTQILGETLDRIGYEKAGIIRPFKPVVCGDNMPDSVVNMANDLKADIYVLGRDFEFTELKNWGQASPARTGSVKRRQTPIQLPAKSAAIALMVIKLLQKDFIISADAIVSGLKDSFLPGRFQREIIMGKEVIFDVAHNNEAASLLATNLREIKGNSRVFAIVGILEDKDIRGILTPLLDLIDFWYLPKLAVARAAANTKLSVILQELVVNKFCLSDTVELSLQQAIAQCQEKDKILLFGSFYTVAHGLRAALKN